ncbi:alpha/beta fold hydrolase [Corynebacterium glyciniphilum]|uniref:alpha/beta fold hydrolase n=1 Tax=Corynebacterium glyciniphilum TaxID=1404244 RepID=UPI003DA13A9D
MTLTPDAAHRYIHTRGIRLHVLIQGPSDAPLVLLIHGFAGGHFDWRELMPELCSADAPPVRVAAVDLRGYGRSDKTPRGYDLTTAASDMCGAIRALGHTDALVVGHGEGGLIAWTMAAHEPQRVRGIVTLASAHPLVLARSVLLHPVSQWPRVRASLYAQLPRLPEHALRKNGSAVVATSFRHQVAPGFRDTDTCREHEELRRDAMQIDKVAHLSCEYRRWTLRSRLRPEGGDFNRTFPARTDAPAVCVDGSMDPAYSRRIARRSAARGGDGSTSELLYGVGHFPHIEDPPAVAAIIRAVSDHRKEH